VVEALMVRQSSGSNNKHSNFAQIFSSTSEYVMKVVYHH